MDGRCIRRHHGGIPESRGIVQRQGAAVDQVDHIRGSHRASAAGPARDIPFAICIGGFESEESTVDGGTASPGVGTSGQGDRLAARYQHFPIT